MNRPTNPSRHSPPPGNEQKNKRILLIGWIFLGVVVLLVIAAALYFLLPRKNAVPETSAAPAAASAGYAAEQQPAHQYTASADGGGSMSIKKILCDSEEPETLTYGLLSVPDLTSVGETAAANAKAAGWGTVKPTLSQDGTLILSGESAPFLNAGAYEQQKEFLASSQPEAMARTFLEQSGLIRLLRDLGLTVSTDAVNEDGEISFLGSGEVSGSECSITFSFLYTGDFNQARIRCSILTDPAVTDEVIDLRRAASQAVTWSSAGDEDVNVDAVEIRSIRGLPFYVFHCDNGENAYALAISRDALAAVTGAEELYEEIMAQGIQEKLVLSGAE